MNTKIELPPTVELLLSESAQSISSRDELERKFRGGFLKELQAQAQFSLDKWEYAETQHESSIGKLVVVPSGVLNPFTHMQKCANKLCRIDNAQVFARSVGLYSDRVLVPDIFTSAVLHSDDAKHASENLFEELCVLNELLPLLRAGVLRFSRPLFFLCPQHRAEITRNVDLEQIVGTIFDAMANEFQLKIHESSGSNDTVGIRNPINELWNFSSISKDDSRRILQRYHRGKGGSLPAKAIREFMPMIKSKLSASVFDVLRQLRTAERAHAVLTMGSRLDALVLTGAPIPKTVQAAENWERIRTIQLPWVRDLEVQEIVELREAAPLALSRMRSNLTARLSETDSGVIDTAKIAQELEGEALEIQSDLLAWKGARGRQFNLGFGALGIALVVYGLAHDTILAAGAAVLSSVGDAYTNFREEQFETAKLTGRPGFVLLKAQELLHTRNH